MAGAGHGQPAAAPAPAELAPGELSPAEVDSVNAYLAEAVAGPREVAYLQVLVEAAVLRDPADTSAVYDVVLRYDPDRYHSPFAGLYPLSFEDQFLQWGKRISLFTRSTQWKSGRFYLHDISTGQQAWIFAEEARRLYPTQPMAFPPPAGSDNRALQAQWLSLMHAVEPATQVRQMSGWLQLMRRESRETVVAR